MEQWPFHQVMIELKRVIGINCLGALDPDRTLTTTGAEFNEGRKC